MIPIKVSPSKIKIRDENTGEFKDITIGSTGTGGSSVNIDDNTSSTSSTWSSSKLQQEIEDILEQIRLSKDDLEDQIEQTKMFTVNVFSSNSTNVVDMGYYTTLSVQLLYGAEDITDQFEDLNFKWSRDSGNKESDFMWNAIRNYHSKSITIDINDIELQAKNDFKCEFIVDDTVISSSNYISKNV